MSAGGHEEIHNIEATCQSVIEADNKVENVTRQQGRSNNSPSPSTYNNVKHCNVRIDLLAKSGEKGAAQKAETLLSQVNEMALEKDNNELWPNTITFNSVLHTWAKSKEQIAATRALALLQRMQELDKSGVKGVKPDNRSYCIVLDCLANSKSKDAADEAERILDLMITQYKAGDDSIKPNTISFSTVINVFAKSRHPDAGKRAGDVFDRMKALGVHPNRRTFNSLISTWANSYDPRAPEKAEACLIEMKRLHKGGDESCQPDTITFNAVINAWATSKDPNAPARAQSLLQEMQQRYIAGDKGCRPDLITYNSLFKVLSRSNATDKAVLAWELLSEMYDRSIQPDDRTFRAVLMVCAFSSSYDLASRKRAFTIAADVMQRAYAETTVSKETFGYFFRAAEALGQSKEVEEVYNWCCEAGFGTDPSILRDLKKVEPNLKGDGTSYPHQTKYIGNQASHPLRLPSQSHSSIKTILLLDSERGSWNKEEWEQAIVTVLHWKEKGTDEGIELAWNLFDRCVHEESKRNEATVTSGLPLERKFLRSLVYAWTQAPNKVPARDVLKTVQLFRSLSPDGHKDVFVDTMIMDTAVKRKEEDAHEFAEQMIKSLVGSSQNNPSARPDTVTFNNAIHALSKSGVEDAPQRAEALLQQMKDLTIRGWDNVKPNVQTYNALISTWANSRQPGAGQRAEALLMESPEPNSRSFCAVMGAWSKSDDMGAPDSCMETFQHMKTLHTSGCYDNVKPDQSSYGTVISALARKGRASEAEEVLRELLNEYERTMNPDLAPSRIHFNALIDAWAKSREKGAAQRAEALVENMTVLAGITNNNALLPDVISFNSVLNAWAKSTDPSAASRAEAILEKMHKMDESGIPAVKPNIRSYNTVLDCLANSKEGAAGKKAEALLETMLIRCEAGELDLRPNIISFNSVIKAFGKSRDRDAAANADALFDRMKALGVNPDSRTFNAIISTWTNSRDPQSAEKAESYFSQMKKLYERGDNSCKPSTIVYNAVLNSCSTSKDPKAFERARWFFNEMKRRADGDSDEDCMPNVITFNSLLNVVGKSIAQDKAVLAWNLLCEMDERGIQPNDRTFGSVLMVCAFSNGFDQPTREQAFRIASKTFQRASAETNPSKDTFHFYFKAAKGLGDEKQIDMAYKICCDAGFQSVTL